MKTSLLFQQITLIIKDEMIASMACAFLINRYYEFEVKLVNIHYNAKIDWEYKICVHTPNQENNSSIIQFCQNNNIQFK